jgi:LuxR family maltose regulon positive regulatory protein
VICLAEGQPAEALGAVRPVLDGTAPVIGYVTVVEAQLLAAFAHRELGDQPAANQAAERALALAEPDRLVLPFALTGAQELLEALPRHETAHAALLTDILDIVRGSPVAPAGHPAPLAQELSTGELRVLRFLPTNLSRSEIAAELSVSLNTIGTHLRRIYAKLGADDRSAAVQRARELRLLSADRTHPGGARLLDVIAAHREGAPICVAADRTETADIRGETPRRRRKSRRAGALSGTGGEVFGVGAARDRGS